MSFQHRFGIGIGGSHEDPYIHSWCEECPEIAFNACPKTNDNFEECRGLYKLQSSTEEATE